MIDVPSTPAPHPQPQPQPQPQEPPTQPRPSGPRPPTQSPPPAVVDRAPPGSPPDDAPVAEDAPRISTGGDWMLPSARIVERLEAVPDAGAPPPTGLQGLPSRGADAWVKNIAAETVGRARVERGLVHSWYGELGKALLKTWDADRAVSRRGLRGYFEQAQENGRAWNGIWMEHAAQYGGSGNPLQGADDAPREPERGPPSVSPSLAARQALNKQMRAEFRATKKATVRVVQDAKGRLVAAELVSPSNDPVVDREALADVRSAAQGLPVPPEEVLAGRVQLVSLWQFELIVSITPPVPSIQFEFDEAVGSVDPRLPLDRRIYKRVRLLAVE